MVVEKSELTPKTGVNQVDTSPEKVDQEWDEIATDEKLDQVPDSEIDASDKGQGTQAQDEPDRETATDNLSVFLWRVLRLLFRKLAPDWHVTESETGKLSDAWSAVICKWLPGAWLRYVPGGGAVIEFDAVVITIDVFEPRWGKPRKSGNTQNIVSEQATPDGGLSKKDISGKAGNKPEQKRETMQEVHDVEAGK